MATTRKTKTTKMKSMAKGMAKDMASKSMDALKLLKMDHTKVKMLFKEFEATSDRATKKKATLINQIMLEVAIHAQCEEEIFYPAFKRIAKEKDDCKLFFEATEEHGIVKKLMPELDGMDASTAEFAAKAKVLKDLIEHHAKEEEKEMFKVAKKEMSRDQLLDLGDQIMERKQQLMAQAQGRARGKKAA